MTDFAERYGVVEAPYVRSFPGMRLSAVADVPGGGLTLLPGAVVDAAVPSAILDPVPQSPFPLDRNALAL